MKNSNKTATFLASFPWQLKHCLSVIIISIILIIIALLPEPVQNQLYFIDSYIEQGEYWRLLTGHLAHSNLNHLYFNLAGLIALWALQGQYYSHINITLICVLSSLIISIGLLIKMDNYQYVGFSAVLHALFAWGSLNDLFNKDKTAYILLAGLIAKLAYEQTIGASQEVEELIGVSVAVDAHLYGALCGIAFGLIHILLINKSFKP